MLPFHQVVADEFDAVNQRILEQLHSDVALVEQVGHYLIDAGGKRLRPLMVLLGCGALGYRGRRQLDLAAIIEFIHTATLLHDDVVDTSERRRGRLTANAHWGNAPAVLVGDFLYSRAFQLMVSLGDMAIMEVLSETTNRIAEGEVQQLANARDPAVTEAGYFDVIEKKTAILFASACEVSAILADATTAQRRALRAYGLHVGRAFQLIDDALDYRGDAETLGKNLGDDLAEGKPTLPLIRTMACGTPQQAELVAEAIRQGDPSRLEAIVAAIEATGALGYTFDKARAEVELARAQLATLPDNAHTRAMAEVADFALTRRY